MGFYHRHGNLGTTQWLKQDENLAEKKMFFFCALFLTTWNSYTLLLLLSSVKKKTFCYWFFSKEELIWHERTQKTEREIRDWFSKSSSGWIVFLWSCFQRVWSCWMWAGSFDFLPLFTLKPTRVHILSWVLLNPYITGWFSMWWKYFPGKIYTIFFI